LKETNDYDKREKRVRRRWKGNVSINARRGKK